MGGAGIKEWERGGGKVKVKVGFGGRVKVKVGFGGRVKTGRLGGGWAGPDGVGVGTVSTFVFSKANVVRMITPVGSCVVIRAE